jgi:pyrroline-5-carboxylate reductase
MNIGFIGIGKIASAVIEGLCTAGIDNLVINVSPRNRENAARLAQKYANVNRMESNQAVLDESDIVIISLTLAVAKVELEDLQFNPRHTVISLIPLFKFDDLSRVVAPSGHVSRAIPLPPVANHNCPIPVSNPNDIVIELFGHLGTVSVIDDETELHTIWALTGLISPFYDMLQQLSDWTVNNGVSRAIANQYLADMYQALAYTAQQSKPIDFAELSKHAATPNGMNEQAGKELIENGAHQLYAVASDNLLKRFK